MSAYPARELDHLRQPSGVELIAVAVAGGPADGDAALLASMIARASGAEVMLVTAHLALPPAVLRKLGGSEATARAVARELRSFIAPGTRMIVESDRSVPRALARVVSREHVDLLVVGSSRRASKGEVRIGTGTRQLLGTATCALAVAPLGWRYRGERELAVIGVGYDGTPEAAEALWQAGSLACSARARLRVRGVVDDRLPYVGLMPGEGAELQEIWDSVVRPDVDSLREDTEQASLATGAKVAVEVGPGSPAEELIALSREVDLLAIGSRHWGSPASVVLGGTGEQLMHGARSAMMVAPRPPRRSKTARR